MSDWLLNSLNASFEVGQLNADQGRGVISLIPKKGKDRQSLRNWHPIILLNFDYKILTKVLDNRMLGVIAKLIHLNQTGFMAGRFIGSNFRNVDDVISFFRSTTEELITSLDYEMAFDTLNRGFLFKVLRFCNFGVQYVRWVRLLYEDAESCILLIGSVLMLA